MQQILEKPQPKLNALIFVRLESWLSAKFQTCYNQTIVKMRKLHPSFYFGSKNMQHNCM